MILVRFLAAFGIFFCGMIVGRPPQDGMADLIAVGIALVCVWLLVRDEDPPPEEPGVIVEEDRPE